MMLGKRSLAIAACLCFVSVSSASEAENWVHYYQYSPLLDLDSIHTEADGITYFNEDHLYKDENGEYVFDENLKPLSFVMSFAMDCNKQLIYTQTRKDRSDWQSHGIKVKANTNGETLMKLVCAKKN